MCLIYGSRQLLLTCIRRVQHYSKCANHYRPISVTCVPCKLLELIVVQKIYAHLSYYGVLR